MRKRRRGETGGEAAKSPFISQAAQLCFRIAAKCGSAKESFHRSTEAQFKKLCKAHIMEREGDGEGENEMKVDEKLQSTGHQIGQKNRTIFIRWPRFTMYTGQNAFAGAQDTTEFHLLG